MEMHKQRRVLPHKLRRAALTVALLVAVAVSPVAWRTVEVLKCEVTDLPNPLVWSVGAVIAHLSASIMIVFTLSSRFLRAAILLSLCVSIGICVLEVALRGWSPAGPWKMVQGGSGGGTFASDGEGATTHFHADLSALSGTSVTT